MNTLRSPSKRSTRTKTITAGETSSSQPDLSKINELYSENMSVRKRKSPDSDFACQFNEFKNEIKKEIVGILQESSNNQNKNIKTISENISSINEKLQNMKMTTEQLIAENKSLTTQIVTLKGTVKENEEKIASLQTEFNKLKSDSMTPKVIEATSPDTYADVFEEFHDRFERSKNIIIVGVPEKHIENIEERRKTDTYEADKIISAIYPGCPKAERVSRVGKYDAKKTRPLKICFSSQEISKTILRTKANLKTDDIRVYSDQTPQQQKFMRNLRNELEQRKEKGEKDLIIKYIKGTPRIIKEATKN